MELRKRPVKRKDLVIKKEITNDPLGVLTDFMIRLEGSVDLDIFYYKSSTVKFASAEELPLSKDIFLAEYDIATNTIIYNKKYFKDAIMHELLHLASTIKTKDVIFSGLCQIDRANEEAFGIGINEALTSLLDDKYFSDYSDTKGATLKNSYKLLKDLMRYVVNIASDEITEEAYFTANLELFVEALSEYIDYDRVLGFIMAMDNIYYALMCSDNKISSIRFTKILFDNYRYIMSFIGELYLSSIFEKYYYEEMDDEEYEDACEYIKEIINQPLRSSLCSFVKSRGFSNREFDCLLTSARNKILKKYT